MGAALDTLAKYNDPCGTYLEAYVRCAEAHAGKRPDVYEEYCEEEKSLFLDCREKQKEHMTKKR